MARLAALAFLATGADAFSATPMLNRRSVVTQPKAQMQVAEQVSPQAALAKAADEARGLAIDSITKAKSGHMGLPLGCAEIGAVLFGQEMCAAASRASPRGRPACGIGGGGGGRTSSLLAPSAPLLTKETGRAASGGADSPP